MDADTSVPVVKRVTLAEAVPTAVAAVTDAAPLAGNCGNLDVEAAELEAWAATDEPARAADWLLLLAAAAEADGPAEFWMPVWLWARAKLGDSEPADGAAIALLF